MGERRKIERNKVFIFKSVLKLERGGGGVGERRMKCMAVLSIVNWDVEILFIFIFTMTCSGYMYNQYQWKD